jgi:diaminopimelate decarboxylase
MSSHEAGALHAQDRSPGWLKLPSDVNELLPSIWPLTAHKNDDGVLLLGGLTVQQIADQVGTGVYVIDEEDFRRRARSFVEQFDQAFASLGGARVHYAAKALISVGIARWLVEDGLSVDVCSGGELEIVLRAGMDPYRVAFHGSNKSDSEVKRALEVGVGRIMIDSLPEISQVSALALELGVTARVLLRCSIGIEAHTHEFIATSHEDQKFGLSVEDGSAMDGVAQALSSPGIELLGVHSHIGSQIFDTRAFSESIHRLVSLTALIEQTTGSRMVELGLGGGFGVAYTSRHDPMPSAQIAAGMAALLKRECLATGIKPPLVTVEPGRAIAAPAGVTLYTVGVVKRVTLDGGFRRLYVSVDGGMSDNIRPALYGADYSATLASRCSQAEPQLARVVGKHCEAGDIVVKDEYLPADIRAGDLLAVPVTGAYCQPMSSNYNALPRLPVVAVSKGLLRVLVRRETIHDLLARDLDA